MRVKSRPDCSCRKIRLLPQEERYGAIGRMSQGERGTEYSRSGIERLFAAECSSGWILDSSEGLDTAPMLATPACHKSWVSRSGTAALSVVPCPGLDSIAKSPPNARARSSMLRTPSPSFPRSRLKSNPWPQSRTVSSNLSRPIRKITFASLAPLCFFKFRSPS
jgi:hypothetical protein